jgi:peptidoglycan hydrolase-like protein with peptidoglycan-binding domain
MTFNWSAHFSGDFGADIDVRAVQARLNELGANPQLTVDGSAGPMTQAAIVAFQQAAGLTPDGVVGPMTLAALGMSAAQPVPVSSGTPSASKVAVPAFPGFVNLPKADQVAFVKAAQWIAPGEPDAPKWLAAIVDFESAKSWSPSKKNPGPSGATGLIQFIGPTARSLGTSLAELAQMSFSQQLEYVKRYFSEVSRTQGRIHSLADMYLSVFSPKGVGKSPGTVLYSSGDPGYDQNMGLDGGSKGFITVGDVASAPLSRLHSVANIPPVLVAMGAGIGAIFFVIGAGALWFFRKKLFM